MAAFFQSQRYSLAVTSSAKQAQRRFSRLRSCPGLLGLNGRGTTINITGNHISSDYDVDRIGNQLVKRLKLAGVKV